MQVASVKKLEKYWFEQLGASSKNFNRDRVVITKHGSTLMGYSGALIFKHEGVCILSVPELMLEQTERRAQNLSSENLFSESCLTEFFGAAVDKIIGPAWIGKITLDKFNPSHTNATRLLTPNDWVKFGEFLSRNDSIEVEHSALRVGHQPTVGVFSNGEVVAAASYEILGDSLAHIGVLSSKTARGKGFAKQAISLVTQIALDADQGIQYQTLKENVASIAAARSLGFEDFAETFAVRLKAIQI